METVFHFFDRLYNTIRYNGFYILLALLFPYIIWKFDAGKEIIVSMTENRFTLNIALSLVTFSASCLSIWCVPTLAIRFFQFVTSFSGKENEGEKKNDSFKIKTRNCLYQQLINVYNGKKLYTEGCKTGNEVYKAQLPVRYFAIAPWVLFVLTCIQVYKNNSLMFAGLFLIIASIILIDRYKIKIIRCYEIILGSDRRPFIAEKFVRRYKILGLCYLTFIIILLLLLKEDNNTPKLQWYLILLNLFFILIFYSFLLYLENAGLETYISIHKPNTDTQSKLNLSYRISNINYLVLLIYLISSILTFYFLNQYQRIEYISPVVIIVTMATVLTIFFELFITSQLLLTFIATQTTCQNEVCSLSIYRNLTSGLSQYLLKFYKFLLLFAIFTIINLYFFSSSNSHQIRVIAVKKDQYIPASARPSLTEYFKNWLATGALKDRDSVVYLISGQGGGSRAAAWFFMNMEELKNRYPSFNNKVFCISTVSGSTTGANMFLAAEKLEKRVPSTRIKSVTEGLYGRNYMSSSFFGLLIGDFVESLVDIGEPFPRDRNYHLQKEELNAFNETFQTDSGASFFENDYLRPYVDSMLHYDSTSHFPLFLINSTIVNFGTRGIFSPVSIQEFSVARDLYGEFKNNPSNAGVNLPMVTCVNQSQAFPILSAYNYIDGIGRLGDGGISENSGCATTLEVYQKLRQYCDSHNLHNIKFVCINITNGNLESNFKVSYEKASIFNTVTAAVNSPFDGSETYAFQNLERQINFLKNYSRNPKKNQDTVINFSLETSITLTRTMSKIAVEKMYNKMFSKPFKLPD